MDNYVVIPQDVPQDAWVYLIITATDVDAPNPDRRFVPGAHPVSKISLSMS